MRVVLDTNILLVSIPRNSDYRIIFDSFLSKKYTILISNEILSEYAEIIAKKTNSVVANNIIEMLLTAKNVTKIDPYFNWKLIIEDKDDNKFVDCAVAGNADFIVTNDKHFNCLKEIDFPPILVKNITEFSDLLKSL
jgi:putative PIN family toxin of toxin-antitoxin system